MSGAARSPVNADNGRLRSARACPRARRGERKPLPARDGPSDGPQTVRAEIRCRAAPLTGDTVDSRTRSRRHVERHVTALQRARGRESTEANANFGAGQLRPLESASSLRGRVLYGQLLSGRGPDTLAAAAAARSTEEAVRLALDQLVFPALRLPVDCLPSLKSPARAR